MEIVKQGDELPFRYGKVLVNPTELLEVCVLNEELDLFEKVLETETYKLGEVTANQVSEFIYKLANDSFLRNRDVKAARKTVIHDALQMRFSADKDKYTKMGWLRRLFVAKPKLGDKVEEGDVDTLLRVKLIDILRIRLEESSVSVKPSEFIDVIIQVKLCLWEDEEPVSYRVSLPEYLEKSCLDFIALKQTAMPAVRTIRPLATHAIINSFMTRKRHDGEDNA